MGALIADMLLRLHRLSPSEFAIIVDGVSFHGPGGGRGSGAGAAGSTGSAELSGGLAATGDVAVVPDVWAQAQPDDEASDPTPMYLADPLADQLDVDRDALLADRAADLVIDTQPGDVPEQGRPDQLD